jgi:hypothetical protein
MRQMKFTFKVECASGHTETVIKDSPFRSAAEEFARVLRTGKCGVCVAKLEVTILDPIEFN